MISLARMWQEFRGLPAEGDLFRDRAKMEAVHERGDVFGLIHGDDGECVMHFSNSIVDTDFKGWRRSGRCQKMLGGFGMDFSGFGSSPLALNLPPLRRTFTYLSARMCLARLNQHQQSHFLISRVASSGELISSNCSSRCCFPTCRKLFVGLHSLTKTNIMLSIRGELNTYIRPNRRLQAGRCRSWRYRRTGPLPGGSCR